MTRYRCTKCRKEADVPCFCSCLANDGETIVEVAALPARAPDPATEIVLGQIERALAEVSALCHGKQWQMRIPVDERTDSDVVIARALSAARTLLGVGAPRLPEPSPDPQQRLSEIRARLNAATPMPWATWRDPSLVEDGVYAPEHPLTERAEDGTLLDAVTICRGMTGPTREANSEFIAAAPGDIQFLLDLLGAVDGGGTRPEPYDFRANWEHERQQFQRETLRTSALSELLRRFIAKVIARGCSPEPWAKSCDLCDLAHEAQTLLDTPLPALGGGTRPPELP